MKANDPTPDQTGTDDSTNATLTSFQWRKEQCLGKRDKSSAGRIDPRAVAVCSAINALPLYYTTSSCSGRCFLYRGSGRKAVDRRGGRGGELPFERFRVCHDSVSDAGRYFDLTTLPPPRTAQACTTREHVGGDGDGDGGGGDDDSPAYDLTGGGDPIPTVGQYDHRLEGEGGGPLESEGKQSSGTVAAAPHSTTVAGKDFRGNDGDEENENLETADGAERGPPPDADRRASSECGGGDATTTGGDDGSGEGDAAAAAVDDDDVHHPASSSSFSSSVVWLRFEPFILHVNCASLDAAGALMDAARPAFKNVGVTSWRRRRRRGRRRAGMDMDWRPGPGGVVLDENYVVAIWGDEGLDMPLCRPSGSGSVGGGGDCGNDCGFAFAGMEGWLASLVNERHERNWAKIERFVRAVREELSVAAKTEEESLGGGGEAEYDESGQYDGGSASGATGNGGRTAAVRRFDVIGDVALLHALPAGVTISDEEELERIGAAVAAKNKAIKICAVRTGSLSGPERSCGYDGGIVVIGGSARNRDPLVTSHCEYGIKCVVDVRRTFFSPRMAAERLRICQQVARGERVLVMFSGVGMEALQIAGRTEAREVVAVEVNPVAVRCAERGRRMLCRNRSVKCSGAADRVRFLEGDVAEVLDASEFPEGYFDRVLAPRPKEGERDGDLGDGDAGVPILELLIPLLRKDGGECHWYDFAADHELPGCTRTTSTIGGVCARLGYSMEILHVANAGSVAKRQFRVCVDFRLKDRLSHP